MLAEIKRKYKFDVNTDRLGPDCPFTHWRLYFKEKMKAICEKKFFFFGENAEFRAGAYAIACSKISIGKNVIIRPGTMLFADPRNDVKDRKITGNIILQDNVMLGSSVHIYVSNHRYDMSDKDIMEQGHSDAKDVILKRGVWIGANCTILSGVVIGENSVVAAGSVVTKSFPPRVMVAGVPAKIIKYLDGNDNAEK